jgi:hypothetical protein
VADKLRIRLEFVGHYRDVCENPASSTLWLDVGRESYLDGKIIGSVSGRLSRGS